MNSISTKLRFFGLSRHCPICGYRARKFLFAGEANRPDAMCPSCNSLERHRLFWLFLQRKTEFFTTAPMRMLHIAPEEIFEGRFRKAVGEGYLTGDLFEENVDEKVDVTDMQFPDDTFDFIYCSHVLEHVPEDRKAMREFYRVLQPGHFAILLVPITAESTIEDPSVTDPHERLKRFGQVDHVRRYGPDYEGRLKESGFRVERIEAQEFLSAREIKKMGITKDAGSIFLCWK